MSARALAAPQKAPPRAKPKAKRPQASPRAKQPAAERRKTEWHFAPSLVSGQGLKAVLQPALEVGPPDDEFEQEADRVADRIMTMPAGAASGDTGEWEDDKLQRKPAEDEAEEETPVQGETAVVQRVCAECAEEEREKGARLQRQEDVEEEPPSGVQPKIQRQEMEEEETAQMASLQRQEVEEEETAQGASLQRQMEEEEETAQTASLQRRMEEEEETAQTASLQRQMEEEETAQTASLQRLLPNLTGSVEPVAGKKEALQTKLDISEPNDQFEQEADRVAERVMRMPDSAVAATSNGDGAAGGTAVSNGGIGVNRRVQRHGLLAPAPPQSLAAESAPEETELQREETDEEEELGSSVDQTVQRQVDEEEEETVQRQVDEEEETVQRQAADEEEEETVQRQAMDEQEEETVQREADEGDETVRRKAVIQRACAACSAELDDETSVQRKVDFRTPLLVGERRVQRLCEKCSAEEEQKRLQRTAKLRFPLARRRAERKPGTGPSFEHDLAKARAAGGRPLPEGVRRFMEPRFGQNFGQVRLHADERADRLNRDVRARAFTVGHHVFFRQGEFTPHTVEGKRLIAHELTHVMQQEGGLHRVGLQRQQVAPDVKAEPAQAEAPPEEEAPEVEPDPTLGGTESPNEGATGETVAGAAGLTVNAVRQFEPPEPAPRAPAPVSGAGAEGAAAPAPAAEAVASATSALQEAIAGDPTPDTPATDTAAPAAAPTGGVAALIGDAPRCAPVGAKPYTEPAEPPPEPLETPATDAKQAGKAEERIKEETFDVNEPDNCPAAEAAAKAGPPETATPPADTSAGAAEVPSPAASAAATAEAAKKDTAGLETEVTPLEAAIMNAETQRDQAVGDYTASNAEAEGAVGRVRALQGGVRFSEEAVAGRSAARAASRTSDFFAGAASDFEQIVATARSAVPEQVGAAAETVKSELSESIDAQKAAVSERIKAARTRAFGAAAHARSQIIGQAAAAITNAETQTQAAVGLMKKAHQTATSDVNKLETDALESINEIYVKGHADLVEVGKIVGQEARSCGNAFILVYSKGIGAPRDSFWEGYLTHRRAVAQVNAAAETAKGYQENLEKAARKQAVEIARAGRRSDRCNVISAAQQHRNALDQGLDGAIAALQSNKENAVNQAKSARDGMLASVNAALASTLTQLDKQEREQRQVINDTGYLQQVVVEQAAHSTAAALQRSVVQAIDQADGGFEDLRGQLSEAAPPDLALLEATLTQAERGIDEGMAGMLGTLMSGIGAAAEQLGNLGTQGAASLEGVAQANDQLATSVNEGFAQAMGGIAANATNSFAGMTATFNQQVQEGAKNGAAAMAQASDGMRKATEEQKRNSKQTLESKAKELAQNLRKKLPELQQNIPVKADEAASREPPAWKRVVAVALIIYVVILVIAVTIVTTIFTLGTGTVLIIAAVVGAISAALITVATNLWENQPWHQGVVKAAAIGAVTGLLGGALGAGVGVALKSASTAVQLVAGFAADLAFDFAVTFVQGGFSFEQLTWGQFLTNLAIMVGTTLLGLGAARAARPRAGAAAAAAEGRPRTAAPEAPAARARTGGPEAPAARARPGEAELPTTRARPGPEPARPEVGPSPRPSDAGTPGARPDTGPAGRPRPEPPEAGLAKPATPEETRVLGRTSSKGGGELSPVEVNTERAVARRGKGRPIDEPPYTTETDLPNNHKLKDSEGSGVKRCSDNCGIYDENGKLIKRESEEVTPDKKLDDATFEDLDNRWKELSEADLERLVSAQKARGISDLAPETPAHKLAAWMKSKARARGEPFEPWAKPDGGTYHRNIANARGGRAREKLYRDTFGGDNTREPLSPPVRGQFGDETVTFNVRERDVVFMHEGERVVIQVKRGKANLDRPTPAGLERARAKGREKPSAMPNELAIQADAQAVKNGDRVIWALEGDGSAPLKEALKKAGIEVVTGRDALEQIQRMLGLVDAL